MKLAIAVIFFAIIAPVIAVEIADLSPEMWSRVRSVGEATIAIEPPSSAQVPQSLSMAACLELASRYNANFRQDQKTFLDARGSLWVAKQQLFYTATGNTEYQTNSGSADGNNTLLGAVTARWERVDGSNIRTSVGAGSSKSFGDVFADGPALSISYERPLYRGVGAASSTSERIRDAQSTLLSRELSFYDAYQRLAQDVIEDYCAVLLARGEVEIADRSVERAKQLYDINYAKFSGAGIALPGEVWVSQVAEIDVDQAKLSWERAKQQLLSRRQTYRDTLDRLLLTMGVTPDGSPELTTAITYDPRNYDEAALVQTALANSTELGRMKQEWYDVQAAKRVAESERLPNVIASVGVNNLGRTGDNGTTLFTGVRVELPIKQRKLTEDVDREERAVRVLEQRIIAARDAVAQEVQRQVRATTASRQRFEIGEQSLALAKKSREAAQGMYDEGLNDYLRVLNAEDRLVEAERSLLQEKVEYFLTTVRLRRAVGEPIAQGLPKE